MPRWDAVAAADESYLSPSALVNHRAHFAPGEHARGFHQITRGVIAECLRSTVCRIL